MLRCVPPNALMPRKLPTVAAVSDRRSPGSRRRLLAPENSEHRPRPRIEAVFRDLVAWDIDLFGSTRGATSG
jgi:hypothetical protein